MEVAAALGQVQFERKYFSNLEFHSKVVFDQRIYTSLVNQQPRESFKKYQESSRSSERVSSSYNPQGQPQSDNMPEETFTSESERRVPTLHRQTRGAPENAFCWKRLVRDTPETAGLPTVVEIWCRECHEATSLPSNSPYSSSEYAYGIDRTPQWTKGELAKYIEPKPRCCNCKTGVHWPWKRFIPVDPSIRSLDTDALRTWGKKHAYMDTDYAIKTLAARKPMNRNRTKQSKRIKRS